MRFILLLFYSLLVFSCSTTVSENSNMVKIESENGNFGLESDYEEEIECEDDEIPCEALSLWVSESFDEGDFEEAINNANFSKINADNNRKLIKNNYSNEIVSSKYNEIYNHLEKY